MARPFKNLMGQRFGRLLVIEKTLKRKRKAIVWLCLCDCGALTEVKSGNLVRNFTKSCGCLQKEAASAIAIQSNKDRAIHGLYRTREYRSFIDVKRRMAKVQRQPKWADEEKIRLFYLNRPEGMTVDHDIALQAKLASGLHVAENLTYMTGRENSRKNNSFTPFIRYRDGKVKYLEEKFWHKENS